MFLDIIIMDVDFIVIYIFPYFGVNYSFIYDAMRFLLMCLLETSSSRKIPMMQRFKISLC